MERIRHQQIPGSLVNYRETFVQTGADRSAGGGGRACIPGYKARYREILLVCATRPVRGDYRGSLFMWTVTSGVCRVWGHPKGWAALRLVVQSSFKRSLGVNKWVSYLHCLRHSNCLGQSRSAKVIGQQRYSITKTLFDKTHTHAHIDAHRCTHTRIHIRTQNDIFTNTLRLGHWYCYEVDLCSLRSNSQLCCLSTCLPVC